MVEVAGITYAYPRRPDRVLDRVGFTLEEGECLAILGNNGAGKSTLLKCIDRICAAHSGTVTVDGRAVSAMSPREMARYIAYLPQSTGRVEMTVFDAVLLGRRPYIRWDVTAEDRAIAREAIGQMGLEDKILRSVSELSGGEAQKVMLARALAQQPKLLLLDEPTSSLDPRNQHEVLGAVRALARERGICVAVVIHDLNLALRYCDKFLFLKGAEVYSCGGIETVTPQAVEDVYGIQVEIVEHRSVKYVIPVLGGCYEQR